MAASYYWISRWGISQYISVHIPLQPPHTPKASMHLYLIMWHLQKVLGKGEQAYSCGFLMHPPRGSLTTWPFPL